MAVCNVITQYIKWEPVQAALTDQEWTKLRSSLVVGFLTDPIRSWNETVHDELEKISKTL